MRGSLVLVYRSASTLADPNTNPKPKAYANPNPFNCWHILMVTKWKAMGHAR
jgi:hypothetical protein